MADQNGIEKREHIFMFPFFILYSELHRNEQSLYFND